LASGRAKVRRRLDFGEPVAKLPGRQEGEDQMLGAGTLVDRRLPDVGADGGLMELATDPGADG